MATSGALLFCDRTMISAEENLPGARLQGGPNIKSFIATNVPKTIQK
jgi:hypothetical protein